MKYLTEMFERQLECLGENTEKYITFTVPIEKQENGKTIKYKPRFIDSVRFMASPLSYLTDNLAVGLDISKCIGCKSSLEYMVTNDDLLRFKCVDFNKTYQRKFNEDLLKIFQKTYKFCDGDFNKFWLVLWKGVYPYE